MSLRVSGDRRTHRLQLIQLSGVLFAAFIAGSLFYLNRTFYHDDAYITLRYARNLLDGRGVVWNEGEYVQGYTNFLHLMIVSVLGAGGIDLVWATRIVGLASLAGMLLVLRAFVTRVSDTPLWHLPVAVVCSSSPLIVWSIGGLESTLFAMFVAAGSLCVSAAIDRPDERRLFVAGGLSLGLAYLTHPNGVVFLGVSAAWLVLTWRDRPSRSAVAFIVPCALLVATYTCWQYWYYGDIVPNTMYAKAGDLSAHRLRTGLQYVAAFVWQPPYAVILVIVLSAYALIRGQWRWWSKTTYLAAMISAYAAYIVFIGGDHMQAFRLFVPLVVPVACLFYLLLVDLVDSTRLTAVTAWTVAVLVLVLLQIGQLPLNPGGEDPAARIGTVVGKYVARAWPDDSLVALNTAGSTPYYARRQRYIDMLGLNDRHIARRSITKTELYWQTVPGHLKGDGAYVLSRLPDFVIVGPAGGTDISDPWFLSDLEMARSSEFQRMYDMHRVRLSDQGEPLTGGGHLFTYYKRRAFPATDPLN